VCGTLALAFNDKIVPLVVYDNVQYQKHARPIFQTRCAECHNSSWKDKNWMDYETAKRNAESIKKRIADKSMPPANYTGMTNDERQMIFDWVDQGAKP